jgi:hypothetical protein
LKALAIASAGLAMATVATAVEIVSTSESAFRIELQGCWTADSHSAEGGSYRMCFTTEGKVSLMSYNEYYREAFVQDAEYWLQDRKLLIAPVEIELWPFSSAHVSCDALIRARKELQLAGCVGDDSETFTDAGSEWFAPWIYDGQTPNE